MKLFNVVIVWALLSSPAFAERLPTANEAKQCIVKSDANSLAGVWGHAGHLCSEYFDLEAVEITDFSKIDNSADLMLTLQYKLLSPALAGDSDKKPRRATRDIVRLCIGAAISSDIPSTISILIREDRKISMQEWATGWKCKE